MAPHWPTHIYAPLNPQIKVIAIKDTQTQTLTHTRTKGDEGGRVSKRLFTTMCVVG